MSLTLAALFWMSAFALPAQSVTMSELMAGNSRMLAPGQWQVNGRAPRCGSTQTLISPTFWDYGGSLSDLIILNPEKMRQLPWRTQLFVYHHECGHQTLGSDEIGADCQAIQTGKREGWLRPRDVNAICQQLFINSAGDRFHPPGPERCEYLRQCYSGAIPAPRRSPGRTLDTLNTR